MSKESWLGYVFMDVEDDFFEEERLLYEGIILRKATLDELSHQFDFHLDRWWSLRGGNAACFAYGRTFKEGVATIPLLDKKDWKHLVVECKNKGVFPWDLNNIFSMSKADLRMGYICLDEQGHMNPWSSWQQLGKWDENDFISYTEKIKVGELEELKKNISDFLSNDKQEKHSRLLFMFTNLDKMVDRSLFKYLGYFSIIEGLLTHKPNSTDNIDSIQKQLVRNINLINNRVKSSGRNGIDYQLFNGAKLKVIFSKLYSLRSDIAHGNDYSKSMKALENLIGKKSEDQDKVLRLVFSWLREVTKIILMYSFVESQLYLDLTNNGSK